MGFVGIFGGLGESKIPENNHRRDFWGVDKYRQAQWVFAEPALPSFGYE